MSRYTNSTVNAAIAAHTAQHLQTIAEAATSRISFTPAAVDDPDRITTIPGPPQHRSRTPELPTDEEIEAALNDARESDPSGQNDRFYYNGYQSREDLTENPVIPPPAGDEMLGGDAMMYYHSVDNTWRPFPPRFDFPEVSDNDEDGGEETGAARRQRKRDKLRQLGVSLFRRVSALRRSKRDGDSRGSGRDTGRSFAT